MSEFSKVLSEMKDDSIRTQVKDVVGRNNPNDLAILFNTSESAFIPNRDGSYSLDPKTHSKEDIAAFDAINSENRLNKKQEYTNKAYEEARNTDIDAIYGSFENQITRDQRTSGMEGMGGLYSAYTSPVVTGLSAAFETAGAPIDLALQAGIGAVDAMDIYSEKDMDQVRDIATVTGLANNPTTKIGKKNNPLAATIGGVAGVLGSAIAGGSIGASSKLAQNGIGVLGTTVTKKIISATAAGVASGGGASSLKGDAEKFRSGKISAGDYVASIARSSVENAAFQLFGDVTQLATSSRLVNGFIDSYAGYTYDILTDKNRDAEIGRFNPMNPDNWSASTILDAMLTVGGNYIQGGTSYRVESSIMKKDLRRFAAAMSLKANKTKQPVIATGIPNAKSMDPLMQKRFDRFAENYDSYAREGSGAITNFGNKNNVHVTHKNFSQVFHQILEDAQLTEGDISKYLKNLDVSNEVYTKRYASAKNFMKDLEVTTARRTKMFNELEGDYKADDATLKKDIDTKIKDEDKRIADEIKAQAKAREAEAKAKAEADKVAEEQAKADAEAKAETEAKSDPVETEAEIVEEPTVKENLKVEPEPETVKPEVDETPKTETVDDTVDKPVKTEDSAKIKNVKNLLSKRNVSKEDIDLLVNVSAGVAKKLINSTPEKLFGTINYLRKIAGLKPILKSEHMKGGGQNLPTDQKVPYELNINDPYIKMIEAAYTGRETVSDVNDVVVDNGLPPFRNPKIQETIDKFDNFFTGRQFSVFKESLKNSYKAEKNPDAGDKVDAFVDTKMREAANRVFDNDKTPNAILSKVSQIYNETEMPDDILKALEDRLVTTLKEFDSKPYNPKEYSSKIDNFATRYFSTIDNLREGGHVKLADMAIDAIQKNIKSNKNSMLSEYFDVYETSRNPKKQSTPIAHNEELESYRQALDGVYTESSSFKRGNKNSNSDNSVYPKRKLEHGGEEIKYDYSRKTSINSEKNTTTTAKSKLRKKIGRKDIVDKAGLTDEELKFTEGYATFPIGDKTHVIYPKKTANGFEYTHSKKGFNNQADADAHLAQIMAERKAKGTLEHTLKGKDWEAYAKKESLKLGKFKPDDADINDRFYKKPDKETGQLKEDWQYDEESNQLYKVTPSGFRITKTPSFDVATGKPAKSSTAYADGNRHETFTGSGDVAKFRDGTEKAPTNIQQNRFNPTVQDADATNAAVLQDNNVGTSELGSIEEIENAPDVSGGIVDADRTDIEIDDPDANYVSQELKKVRDHFEDTDVNEQISNPFVSQPEAIKWHSYLGRESFDRAISDIMAGEFSFDNIVNMPGTKQMTYVKNAEKVGMVENMSTLMAEDMLDAAGRIFGEEFIQKKTTMGFEDYSLDVNGKTHKIKRKSGIDDEYTTKTDEEQYLSTEDLENDLGVDEGYAVNQAEYDLMKNEDADFIVEDNPLLSKMSVAGNAISAIKDFFKSKEFVQKIAGKKDASSMIKEFENFAKKYDNSNMKHNTMIYKQQYSAIVDNKAQLQDRFGNRIINDLINQMSQGNDVSDYILIDPALSKTVFKDEGLSTNLINGYRNNYKNSGGQGPTIVLGKDPKRFSADKNFGTEYRSEDSRFIYLDGESIKSSGRTSNEALSHELGHKLFEEILPPEAKLTMFKKYVKNKDIKKSLRVINKGTGGSLNKVYGDYYKDIMRSFGSKKNSENLSRISRKIKDLSKQIDWNEEQANKAFLKGNDKRGDEFIDFINDELVPQRIDLIKKLERESGARTSDSDFIAEVGAEMMAFRMLEESGLSDAKIEEIIKVSDDLSTSLENDTHALMESARMFTPNESKIHVANSKLFVDTEGLMRTMYKSIMNKTGYRKGINPGDGTLAGTRDLGRMYFASPEAIKAMGLQKSELATEFYNNPVYGNYTDGLHLPDTRPKNTNDPEVRKADYGIGAREQALGISEEIISTLNITDVKPHIHYGIKRMLTGEDNLTKLQSIDFAKFYAEHSKVIDSHVKRYGFLKKGMDLAGAIKSKGARSAFKEAKTIYNRELMKLGHNTINRKNYILSLADDVMQNFEESAPEYLAVQSHVESIRRAEYSGAQTEMNVSELNNGIRQIGLTHQELNLFADYNAKRYTPNSVLRSKFERLDTLMDDLITKGEEFAAKNSIDFKSVNKKNVIDFTNDYIDSMTSIDYQKLKSEFAQIIHDLEKTPKGMKLLKDNNINLTQIKNDTYIKLKNADNENVFGAVINDKVRYYKEDSGIFDFYNEGTKGKFSDNDLANNSVRWLNKLYYKNVLVRNGAFLVSGTLRDYHTFKRKSEMDSLGTIFSSIPKYAKNIKKAFKDLRNNNNEFSEEYIYLAENGLLASTGTKGGILSRKEINDRIKQRVSRGSDLSIAEKIKGFVPGVEMFVEDMLTATDRASRYTEYEYLKELEGDDFKLTSERANNIRNLGNPNPFEKGAKSNEIGSVLMFYNSIIRGFAEDANHIKRLYKQHGNNKNKVAIDLMKRNVVTALPTVIFALADLGLFGQDTKEVYNKTSIKDLASGKSTPVAGIYNKNGKIVGSVNSSLGILDEQQQILSQAMMMAYKGGINLIEEVVGQPKHDSDVELDDAMNIIKTTIPDITPVFEALLASYHLGTDTYFTDNFNSPVVSPNDGFGTNAVRTVGYVGSEFGFGIFQNKSNWADRMETNKSIVGDIMDFKSKWFISKVPVVDVSIPYLSNAAAFMGKEKRFNPNAIADYGRAKEANAKERLKAKYGSK